MYEKYIICIGSIGHLLFVFQTIKIIRSGSSNEISLLGFCVSFASLLSWLFYGILKKDIALIIVNTFGSLAALACIITILMFR
jgi:MtN3 and saliva related transmembrane protein